MWQRIFTPSLYYTAQSSATLHLESPASIADESTKTLFPTSIRHDNKDYRLLGLGVRQVTLLRISVYVLGLYIPDSTVLRPDVTSLADLVRSPVPLAIRLEPVRNTTGAHLRDGFKAMDVINDFKAKFPKGSISKGEVLTLYRNADGQVEIEYQGTSYGTIRSSWLASSLFLAYVREDSPISPKARQSILEGRAAGRHLPLGAATSTTADRSNSSSIIISSSSTMEDVKKKGTLAKWKVRAGEFKEKARHQSEKWIQAASEKKNELSEEWKEKRRKRKDGGEGEPIQPIFGSPLAEAVDNSRIDENCALPAVVIRCIEYLDGRGLHEVGLYRISGSATAVAHLKAIFDQGDDIDFLLESEPVDVHSVATLFKMYLREHLSLKLIVDPVPENILGDLLADLTQCITTQPDIQQVAALARQLPLPNYYLLSWLCSHLARLVYYADTNKMSLNNLALIFCPTLRMDNIVFSYFVDNVVEIFPMNDDGQVPLSGVTETIRRSIESAASLQHGPQQQEQQHDVTSGQELTVDVASPDVDAASNHSLMNDYAESGDERASQHGARSASPQSVASEAGTTDIFSDAHSALGIDSGEPLACASARTAEEVTVVDMSATGLSADESEANTVLSQFPNISEVDASETRLQLAHFTACKRLSVLSLACCAISKISKLSHLDGDLLHLHTLDLSFNSLQTYDIEVLASLPSLIALDLSGNSLTRFPFAPHDAPIWFPELRRLSLAANGISSQQSLEAIGELARLHQLDLSENNVQAIQLTDTVPVFRHLEQLTLCGNRIPDLRSIQSISQVRTLKSLFLAGNPLIQLKTADELQALYCWFKEHGIELLDEAFKAYRHPVNKLPAAVKHRDRRNIQPSLMLSEFKSVPDTLRTLQQQFAAQYGRLPAMSNTILKDINTKRTYLEHAAPTVAVQQPQKVPAGPPAAAAGPSDAPATTFITATTLEEEPALDDIDLDEYFAEFNINVPVHDGVDVTLPKDIVTSVKLLRKALSNPVFYWSIVKSQYAQPTASTRAKGVAHDSFRLQAMRKQAQLDMNQSFGGGGQNRGNRLAPLPAKTQRRQSSMSPAEPSGALSPASTECADASRPGTAPSATAGKRNKKGRARDDLQNLYGMMNAVTRKLEMIERNLVQTSASVDGKTTHR
ncbi:hypothetical protein RI367_004802 [Sorochytrium milnesiophthora]